MKLNIYVKAILLVVFVIIGILLIMASGTTTEIIDSKLIQEHKKAIYAYDIIDMEKDRTKAINDMIIKSDTMLSKSESGVQLSITEETPIKIKELDELLNSDTEKESMNKILEIRSSLDPIQDKILKLLNIQARTAELILLYGDMKNLQEKYFTELKAIITNANTHFEEAVDDASGSASNVNIVSYILLILGSAIIILLFIDSFSKRKVV
jgi:hypothetical protein